MEGLILTLQRKRVACLICIDDGEGKRNPCRFLVPAKCNSRGKHPLSDLYLKQIQILFMKFNIYNWLVIYIGFVNSRYINIKRKDFLLSVRPKGNDLWYGNGETRLYHARNTQLQWSARLTINWLLYATKCHQYLIRNRTQIGISKLVLMKKINSLPIWFYLTIIQ